MARKSWFIVTAALRLQRWPGARRVLCSLSRRKTAKRVFWSSERALSSREQRLPAPVSTHEHSVGENDVFERPKAPAGIFPRVSHAGGGTGADRFLARGNDARQRPARAGNPPFAGLTFRYDQR